MNNLKKLPQELLNQPRFFEVSKDKVPHVKDWSNPANQKFFSDVQGLAGFDTCGHGQAADYLFLDWDNVLDDNGHFVNVDAEKWFNYISSFETYCELSIRKHGLHHIFKPTPNKFPTFSAGKNGTIHFGDKAKLEIFYGSQGRYCLFTGDVFNCEPNTPIVDGVVADEAFRHLINELNKQNAPKPNKSKSAQFLSDSPDYDDFRAGIMLDYIVPADLPDTDWLAVISSAKNLGISYHVVDAWNHRDPDRYNEKENLNRWDSLDDPSFDIETLHGIAKRFGYSEKETRRQWYQLHPELNKGDAPMNDDNKIRTRDRIKDCPVNLIIPDNFILDNNEITQVVPSKKEGGNPKYVCVARTPIIPTKIFREPSKCKFSYQIAILTRGVWRTTEIDGRTLADPRAIINLADCGALILEPKILCRFLNDIISLNPDLNEIKAYSQTGWTDDDFTTFAYPHSDDCIVRRAGFDFDKDLGSRGNADQWKDKLIEVLDKGGAVAAMYIGTALTSVLARPLNIMNPQAHLHGTSGSGKTALQKFTASIFGNPRKLKRSFAATNKNRQLVSAAFCDLPTFYDELETIQGKKAEEQLSTDIYNFADGKGNQANKRDGSARDTFEFGGSRLTTGERPILKDNDLRGAYKRLIQLPIQGHLFDDNFAADLHFFSESNFGHFGKPWIDFATKHMQDIQKKFQYHATFYDPTLKNFEPTHIKAINAALIAVEFFKVMLGINATFDEDCTFIRNRRTIIDTLPTLADLDDTERALDALNSYVSSHEKSFTRDETSNETGKPIEIGSWGTICPGKIFDTGAVAFFPTELKRILEDELHFASAEKLINAWILDGTLKADSGRKTQVIRLGKRTYRVYYFKAGKISSSTDSAELHYYDKLGVTD